MHSIDNDTNVEYLVVRQENIGPRQIEHRAVVKAGVPSWLAGVTGVVVGIDRIGIGTEHGPAFAAGLVVCPSLTLQTSLQDWMARPK